jgi:hypothetical protein
MTFDLAQFKRLFELDAKRKQLEKQIKEIDEEYQKLETVLLEVMEANDLPQMKIGGSMCHPIVRRFAMVSNKKEAIQVLKKSGYDDFISEGYNANSISKLCRDLVDEHGKLPPEFGNVIKLGESKRLGIKSSSS